MFRRATYILPITLFLLLSVPAHAQIEILPPAEPIEVHIAVPLVVQGLSADDVARSAVICYPAAKIMGPISIAGKHYLCFQAATPGAYFLAIAVSSEGPPRVGSITFDVVSDPDIPDDPPPPPPDDLASQTATWLQDVRQEARDAEVTNPMTGETMTRQQAVGATYTAMATVAEALGSVQATQWMLKRGLDASFGEDGAADWQPFADRVAEALAGITDAVEYGAALAIVGGVLG